MLFSLLPGVRQLRAPLAAGFVWLVAGWFAFAASIPPPETAVGPLSDVYRLAALAGETGVIAAAGFSAYLLGTLTVRATSGLTSFTWPPRPHLSGSTIRLAAPSPAGQDALRQVVLMRLAERTDGDADVEQLLETARMACKEPKSLADDAVRRVFLDICLDVDYFVERIEEDLELIPLRLLGDVGEAETYAEFDRKRAEAEFRAAVCVPLAALVAVLAARTSWWVLLALALPLAIVLDGRRHAAAAADVLAESIRARGSVLPAQAETVDPYAAKPLSPAVERIMVGPLKPREEWLEQAAKRYPSAMLLLARQSERSDQPRTAEHWFRKAARLDDPEAMMWMALTLHRRDDTARADDWFRKAVGKGQEAADVIATVRDHLSTADLDAIKSAYAGKKVAMIAAASALLAVEPARWDIARSWLVQAVDANVPTALDVYIPLLRARGEDRAAQIMEERRLAQSGRG